MRDRSDRVTEGPLGVGMVRNDRRCKERSVQVQRKGGPGALTAQWTKEAPEHTSDLWGKQSAATPQVAVLGSSECHNDRRIDRGTSGQG